jgi:hypothetical protein
MVGPDEQSIFSALTRWLLGLSGVTFGTHGVLSHFPLLLLAGAGLVAVTRRHWPDHAKMLACVTLVASMSILALAATRRSGFDGSMFATRWAVVVLPLAMFWLGAMLRPPIESGRRSALIGLASLSVIFSLAGATMPLPSSRFEGHTATAALERTLDRWLIGSSVDVPDEPMARSQ